MLSEGYDDFLAPAVYTHLFFAHPRFVKMLQESPEVLLVNTTYKTDLFRLPLIVLVGVTGPNTTFVGFSFSREGKRGGFYMGNQEHTTA